MVERFEGGDLLERAPEALSRRVLDGLLVLGPDMSEVLEISAPGDVVWALLREPITVSELVVTLSDLYGVQAQTVRTQVQPTLEALLDGGALWVTAAPSPRVS
ncbi:MAG: hypothetical protein ACJAR2_000037 [Ilumatobacter sp.]|jgi:hypothetical protein